MAKEINFKKSGYGYIKIKQCYVAQHIIRFNPAIPYWI